MDQNLPVDNLKEMLGLSKPLEKSASDLLRMADANGAIIGAATHGMICAIARSSKAVVTDLEAQIKAVLEPDD